MGATYKGFRAIISGIMLIDEGLVMTGPWNPKTTNHCLSYPPQRSQKSQRRKLAPSLAVLYGVAK